MIVRNRPGKRPRGWLIMTAPLGLGMVVALVLDLVMVGGFLSMSGGEPWSYMPVDRQVR